MAFEGQTFQITQGHIAVVGMGVMLLAIIFLLFKQKDLQKMVSKIAFVDPYEEALKQSKIQCPTEIKGKMIWLKGTNLALGMIIGYLTGVDIVRKSGRLSTFFYVPQKEILMYQLSGGTLGEVTNVMCNVNEHSPLYGDVFLYGIGIDAMTGTKFHPLITKEYDLIKSAQALSYTKLQNTLLQLVSFTDKLVEKAIDVNPEHQKGLDNMGASGANSPPMPQNKPGGQI